MSEMPRRACEVNGIGFEITPMLDSDGPSVLGIYEEGISSRQATFEVGVPSWEMWDGSHLASCRLVARASTNVVGWAALSPVSMRTCYVGVAEVSIYVSRACWGQGIGSALLAAVIVESEAAGFWTLQGATFPENAASLRLQTRFGFREIGRRERIAVLDGVWRDTVLTERRSSRVGSE